MSLNATVIPPAVLRAFTSGLGNYIDPSRPLWSVMQQEYVAQPWWSLVLPQSPEPTTPSILTDDRVIPTGWRFVATNGDAYGGCHVGSVSRDNPPTLTGFSWDAQILTFMERLQDLKALPEVGKGQFDLRVLCIRWLHFEAFWLYATDVPTADYATVRGRDILIPYTGFLEGPPNHLELMNPYPVQDFLTAIWPCVHRAVTRDQELKGKASRHKSKSSADKAREAALAQQESAQKADDAAHRVESGSEGQHLL